MENENIFFLQLSTHPKSVTMFLFVDLFNITSKVSLYFTSIGLMFYFFKKVVELACLLQVYLLASLVSETLSGLEMLCSIIYSN